MDRPLRSSAAGVDLKREEAKGRINENEAVMRWSAIDRNSHSAERTSNDSPPSKTQ